MPSVASVKKDIKKWILYSKCMINDYSIRKCAEIVGISVPTSFYWRHKFLDAIRVYMGIGNVGGVIEVDEAFFRESFKGNHKKITTFIMPREPHKRGEKAVGVVRMKREKEVYQRNRSVYYVPLIEWEIL